ncbi:MAG: molybdopterin molybdotransferase MoeA [Rhodobiaceae bacterium]|nr:molybdopterin molybdotransferase MoeA [Rhodobiaceae bacterium]MCC0016398.1 molybdopterin molybdotransferase MoeA [Rhodobiaceae bacterium]MCC0041291.1 molybdopterin molybdotransferase MoeA [Rhodobiaceae bacterium]MCC0052734.1 molybdopterin molybdotransferase MoeA [Rhodobiaceae bacterium]
MSLLPVAEALARMLDGIEPTGTETVPIIEAAGRVVASPLAALRTQPPWATSAMDGYAVRGEDVTSPAQLSVIGQSAAGHAFGGEVGEGEAVRIFTGAPLPAGADTIVMQENVETDGTTIRVPATARGRFVRPRGLDFSAGDELVPAGTRLGAATLALAAAMGHAQVPVRRKPRFAILATGDELVLPGEEAGPDQIVASNNYGVAAMVCAAGAAATDLGIAPDDKAEIATRLNEGIDAQADVIVTTGGASVGDHDLVQPVLKELGVEIGFWKVAMRPGKPLMMGRRGRQVFIGLPGNPVSALVCTRIFLVPMARALLGLPATESLLEAELGADLAENDQRQDHLRATLEDHGGRLVAAPFSRQDSSMLATLARSHALIVRPPHAPAAKAGTPCHYLPLEPGC